MRPVGRRTFAVVTARTGGTESEAVSPSGTSFARRHPILTAFGVLAGLSLFAAYFPISAFVTAAVVGARATGIDRRATRAIMRVAGFISQHWRSRHAHEPPSQPPGNDGTGVSRPSAGTPGLERSMSLHAAARAMQQAATASRRRGKAMGSHGPQTRREVGAAAARAERELDGL